MTVSGARYELRMRTGREAADMGLLLWRDAPWTLCASVALPVLCVSAVFIALYIVIPHAMRPGTAPIALFVGVHFYLKPFYDRFTMQIVSKLFFVNKPSFADFKRGFASVLTRGLAGDLLWRRFSPVRGVMLPLRVLEAPDRSRYASRKEALANGGIYSGFGITVFCLLLSVVLSVGVYIFFNAAGSLLGIRPDSITKNALRVAFTVMIMANIIVSEALYVCMSFAVYINSRVITEGWDLELKLKKLAMAAEKK